MYASRIRTLAASLAGGLVIVTVGAGGQAPKPTIVIETFENPSNYSESTIGNALTDMFVTELARAGRFRVLDSSNSGAAEGTPDLLFRAKVTNFSYEEIELEAAQSSSGRVRAEALYQQNTEVRIDFRVVDPQSDEVIFADAGLGHHAATSSATLDATLFRSVVASSESTHELLNSMMGQASSRAIDEAMRRLSDYCDIVGFDAGALQGTVLGVVDLQTVVIDIGLEHGLGPGTTLSVFREAPITNSEGVVVYYSRQQVATVEVIESQPDRALAHVSSGSGVLETDLVSREAAQTDLPTRLDRAWRLLDKQFYSPALREFQEAREIDRDSIEAIHGTAWADLYLRKFPEAFAGWDELLDRGATLELPIHHHHSFNHDCDGVLLLSGGSLVFPAPPREDPEHGFEVALSEVAELETKDHALGFKAPNNVERDWKKWNFQVLLAGSEALRRPGGYVDYPPESAEIHREIIRYVARRVGGA